MKPLKHDEQSPNYVIHNATCGYIIHNAKALKNRLIFEDFHFFLLKFPFLRYGLCRNTKKCRTLSLEVRGKAAEIIT